MRFITTFSRILLIVVFVLLIAGRAGNVSAGSTVGTGNSPEGGVVGVLMIDPQTPTTLYAGTRGGVYKSTNGGMDWGPINTGLTHTSHRIYLPLVTKTSPSPGDLYVLRGPDLQVSRMGHTATRLTDGRILLVGGSQATDVFLVDVDIFDPVTGQTSQAAPLHTPRHAHSATLLADGRVLVIGGYNNTWGWLSDAEVYDPVVNTWTVVPPRYSHGVTHSATLMQDGRILVVGGLIGSSWYTERVEIFNPQTNSWTEASPLPAARANHTAQLLEDGRVLVAGGQTDDSGLIGGDAMLYDPAANTWTETGPMIKPRTWAQSVRLQDGRVLVAGGMTLEDMPTNTFSASAEIYDPTSNAWTAMPPMAGPRYSYSLALLPTGQALAVGGARDWDCCWTDDSFVREIEVFEPVANQWRTVADLPQPRASAAAAALPDGRVWLSGGRTNTTYLADTWWLVDAQTAARLGLY